MSNENTDGNTTPAEEEYEVERIVGHKVIRNRKQKASFYFVLFCPQCQQAVFFFK